MKNEPTPRLRKTDIHHSSRLGTPPAVGIDTIQLRLRLHDFELESALSKIGAQPVGTFRGEALYPLSVFSRVARVTGRLVAA